MFFNMNDAKKTGGFLFFDRCPVAGPMVIALFFQFDCDRPIGATAQLS